MVSGAKGQASLIGATLGDYEVLALIGRGAMGTVYLARDVKLNRHVALKVLLGSMAANSEAVRQFQMEAQTAAPLDHPCVVRVYSAGIDKDTPYMAMEFVDGEPLDQFLRRRGRLKWQQAFHIVSQVALALDCAHRNNVVHRDVKPSNIMLDKQGRVRLTDFGIAQFQNDQAEGGGAVVGTPQYMSPEHCTGQEVSALSDLYSLGVVAFQMIAGELPFRGESNMALIKSVCTDEAPRLNKVQRGVPDDVARLVAYMMEKKPEHRPANARVLHALVSRLQKQKGGVSAIPSSLESFIMDKTEPRPFSSIQKRESKLRKSKRGAVRFSQAGLRKGALVGVLALFALIVTPTVTLLARNGSSDAASQLNLAYFTESSQGGVLAHCFVDGYRFEHITWVGDQPVLLAEAEGVRGTMAYGGRGLIAINPEEEVVSNVRPPSAPSLDSLYWDRLVPGLTHQVIPSTSVDSPLHDSILVQARASKNRPVALFAQRWDRATPQPAVLFHAPLEQWSPGLSVPSQPPEPSRVLVNPDGETVCLILHDASSGNHYMVERKVNGRPTSLVDERLTSPQTEVIPRSVQYGPSGDVIFYSVPQLDGRFELWRVARGETNGSLVVSDMIEPDYAQSPNGERVAVMVPDEDGAPEVTLVSIAHPTERSSLGPGRVSSASWHASNKAIIVRSLAPLRGGDPREQLHRVELEAPHERRQITFVRAGLEGPYAVSRTGGWVAAVVNDEDTPTLVFVKLDEWTSEPL